MSQSTQSSGADDRRGSKFPLNESIGTSIRWICTVDLAFCTGRGAVVLIVGKIIVVGGTSPCYRRIHLCSGCRFHCCEASNTAIYWYSFPSRPRRKKHSSKDTRLQMFKRSFSPSYHIIITNMDTATR